MNFLSLQHRVLLVSVYKLRSSSGKLDRGMAAKLQNFDKSLRGFVENITAGTSQANDDELLAPLAFVKVRGGVPGHPYSKDVMFGQYLDLKSKALSEASAQKWIKKNCVSFLRRVPSL